MRPYHEQMESRLVLSAIAYVEHDVSSNQLGNYSFVLPADLNGDGRMDIATFVVDFGRAPNISWFNVQTSERRIIPVVASYPVDLAAGDVDQDGDVDLVIAGDEGAVSWLENLDGKGSFSLPIRLLERHRPTKVQVVDINNDGKNDLLVSTFEAVEWWELDGQSQVVAEHVVAPIGGTPAMRLVDIDGDQDVDIIAAFQNHSLGNDDLIWFENRSGDGTVFEKHVIASANYGFYAVDVADINQDGNLDIVTDSLTTTEVRLLVIENLGRGQFAPPLELQTASDVFDFAGFVDVDGDGAVDVLVSARHQYQEASDVLWFRNTSGESVRFALAQSIPTDGAAVVASSDLDDDARTDLITINTSLLLPQLGWKKGIASDNWYAANQVFAQQELRAVQQFEVGDVDGDGDLDVVSTSGENQYSFDRVQWYENDGGAFHLKQVMSVEQTGPKNIAIIDWDLDGDLDVVIAEMRFGDIPGTSINQLVWYANDSKGNFGSRQLYSKDIGGSLAVGDVDGDGHVDLINAANRVSWYKSGDSTPTRREIMQRDPTRNVYQSAALADIDGDGLTDIVVISTWFTLPLEGHGTVVWIRNLGQGQFSEPVLIDEPVYGSLTLTDFNDDGRTDVIVADASGILWYENQAGAQMSIGHPLTTNSVDERLALSNVQAADLDGDGDIDLVNSFTENYVRYLVWYENTGGHFFTPQTIQVERLGYIEDVAVADIDRDGRLDVVSASLSDIRWYDRRMIGDTDRDGYFTSFDLVQVFQTGEYEDGLPLNSVYDEGDWDGNGEFDSADLVLAFQSGNYEIPAAANAHDSIFAEIGAAVNKPKAFVV